mmetsp:Transcript_17505/g.2883  ORF Transcript_17505/g.2883 Transcript_17505/m.2883 type:complete len:106 (+) Transcript_17505:60-377(+)
MAKRFILGLSFILELFLSESNSTFSKLSISDRFLVVSFGEVSEVLFLLLLKLTKSPSTCDSFLEMLGVSGKCLNQASSKSFPVASIIPLKFSATASYKVSVYSNT